MGVKRRTFRRPEGSLALLFGLAAQLPSQFGDFRCQRHPGSDFRICRRSIGVRLVLFRSGMSQADLLELMAARFRQGPFAPPGLAGFFATMDPSDSRPGRPPVMFSRRSLSAAAPAVTGTGPGLSGSVFNLSTPAVLSHPGEPVHCIRSLLRGRCWLHPFWRVGRSQWFNEAETGSLALRLTFSFPQAPSARSLPPTPRQLHV